MGSLTAIQTHPPLSHRNWLRAATQSAHEEAEARWFAPGTFASHHMYARWLRALRHAHCDLGAQAVRIPGLERFARTEQARANALCLDLELPPLEPGDAPRKPAGWGWGVLYVLNGSAMGASFVLKSGSVEPSWSRHYLEEMRCFATSGALKAFFDRLNAADVCPDDMLTGANDVFEFLSAQA